MPVHLTESCLKKLKPRAADIAWVMQKQKTNPADRRSTGAAHSWQVF